MSIDSFAAGDYVTGRPFLAGTAGWFADPAEAPAEETPKGKAKTNPDREVSLVEVSMDNGATFAKADGRESWKLRLESTELPNGPLRLLVKATFAGGGVAVTRVQLTVDTRAPQVTLREPQEGGRFNESVQLTGAAYDESGLKEIAVSLRQGDKSRYQVPSFIQGLYLDAHTMGATWWDVGLGLTFFDDNVKLQAQIGHGARGTVQRARARREAAREPRDAAVQLLLRPGVGLLLDVPRDRRELLVLHHVRGPGRVHRPGPRAGSGGRRSSSSPRSRSSRGGP